MALERLNVGASPAPGIRVAQIQRDTRETFRLDIRAYSSKVSHTTPLRLIISTAPGRYRICLLAADPHGRRRELWSDVTVLHPTDLKSIAALVNTRLLATYSDTHLAETQISTLPTGALDPNRVAHLYLELTPAPAAPDEAPAATILYNAADSTPLVLLLDSNKHQLAYTVTPFTHGSKTSHLRATTIERALHDDKHAPQYRPTQTTDPQPLPEDLPLSPPPLAPPPPPPAVTDDAIAVACDLRMRLRRMEIEAVVAWGTLLIVVLAILLRLLHLS